MSNKKDATLVNVIGVSGQKIENFAICYGIIDCASIKETYKLSKEQTAKVETWLSSANTGDVLRVKKVEYENEDEDEDEDEEDEDATGREIYFSRNEEILLIHVGHDRRTPKVYRLNKVQKVEYTLVETKKGK